jgi:DNA topoisomerase III
MSSMYDTHGWLLWNQNKLIIMQDKKAIAQNISDQARYARLLVIWTDCDREGEHIGDEIVQTARKGNPGILVKRAKFSNVERA